MVISLIIKFKTFLALIAALLFGLYFSATSEAAPPKQFNESQNLSFTITLLEDTPMYASPDEMLEPTGVIEPQDVHIVGAEANWTSFQKDTDKKWFKAETWQGDRWIWLEIRKTGAIQKTDMNVWLPKDAHLYNSPFPHSGTELELSSQAVHVVAQYRSKFQNSYLAETWLGQKWLVDLSGSFFAVTKIHQQIDLTETTSIFDMPIPYNGDKSSLEPQIVTASEQYNDNWYRIVTAHGGEGWINKKFAQPAGAKQTQESVFVSVLTPLQKYPYVYEINMGSLAPQTVKAFETWISPEGEAWYHIHSWQGDAWIRTAAGQYITEEAALGFAKQMDPNGNGQWTAKFAGEYPVEPSKEIRPVWVVTAVYPAGNKMIVYIDAVTGKQLALTETEAGV